MQHPRLPHTVNTAGLVTTQFTSQGMQGSDNRMPVTITTGLNPQGQNMANMQGVRQMHPVNQQMRPQMGGPPQRPQASHQGSSQQEQIDPISKAKAYLPHLRESLVNLMAVASQNFSVTLAVDECKKMTADSSNIPKFDKCLEHFYSLCDQLETQLTLAHQQLSQMLLSAKYTPVMTNMNLKNDHNSSQTYGNYVAAVEQQLRCAKEMHDLLSMCVQKLSDHQTNHPILPSS